MPDARGHWPLEAITLEVGAQLPGFCAELLPAIDSTNSELMRRARAGRDAPTLLVAEVQLAGRGRLGRTWVSQDAAASGAAPIQRALTFSVGMPLSPQDWSGLSLAVGVSVARSLHPALQLKWPNDLWFEGRKVPLEAMRLMVLPLAIVLLLLPLAFPGGDFGALAQRPLFVPHLLAGTLAYGVLMLAALVALLCGPAGDDITGTAMPVDGGWSIS